MSKQGDDDFGISSDSEESEIEEKGQSIEVLENFDVEFEEKLLKANKNCLIMISPVIKVIFKGEFKEIEQTL